MNFDEIKRYWNQRATTDTSVQSTTQDAYLREIEYRALADRIGCAVPARIADVGCGDGRTTARLATRFPMTEFIGFDYSSSMIENARCVHADQGTNLRFEQSDVCEGVPGRFNLIYTTRCLINLPSWHLQKGAIASIHSALNSGGSYLMVENFVEGHESFNRVRRDFGLPEITVRDHNLFFVRDALLEYVSELFDVEEEVNISSAYYLVSRVIYSRICIESGKQPDYFDDHHRLAAELPFCGEFGPVRLVSLKKK
ncbi:MAG: class I SAM-dependent methyltransferase [Methylococcus sp.]|nr:class I SAM-dependent methyltransferase [Methylococcus sp.]